jgi:hypothetical protein
MIRAELEDGPDHELEDDPDQGRTDYATELGASVRLHLILAFSPRVRSIPRSPDLWDVRRSALQNRLVWLL